MNVMNRVIVALAVVALAVGFLGYTKTGERMMANLGLTAACDSGCN